MDGEEIGEKFQSPLRVGSSQAILLARRAPTMKRWSLDARSEGQPDLFLFKKQQLLCHLEKVKNERDLKEHHKLTRARGERYRSNSEKLFIDETGLYPGNTS